MRRFAAAVGLGTIGVGVAVLTGWLLDIDWLKGGLVGGITMKANAAVCVIAAGLSILLQLDPDASPARRWPGQWLAGLVALVALLTLIEHIGRVNLGIDTLLASEPAGEPGTSAPGRMGPPATLCLGLIGVALVVIDRKIPRVLSAQLLAAGACAISLLALVGYVYGATELFGIASRTGIAALTAGVLLLLGLAILASRPNRGVVAVLVREDPGGMLARRALPVLVVLPIAVGWLGVRTRALDGGNETFGAAVAALVLVLCLAAFLWRTAADVSRSEQRIAAIVESSEDAIISKDLDGRIRSFNPAAERMYGYRAEEVIGRSIAALIPPERRAEEAAILARIAAGERIEPFETVRVTKEGRRLHVLVTVSPIRNAEGRVVGASKIARDIGGAKLAAAQLDEANRHLRFVAQAADIGTWEWDLDSDSLVWSDRCRAIFGVRPDEPVSFERFMRALHPDDRPRVEAAVRACTEGRGDYEVECRAIWPDGSQRWVLTRGRMGRVDGHGRRMAGIALDITGRKAADEELARYREHLEELVAARTAELERSQEQLRTSERMAALGTLSAGLGHDMGNLLLPLRMRLEALADEAVPEQVRKDLRAIDASALYLQRLANSLRLFAADPDEDRSNHAGTDLREWWRDAEPLLRTVLPRGVALEAGEGVAEGSAPLPRAAIAPNRLMQAVFNLVQNAGEALTGIGLPDGRQADSLPGDRAREGAVVRVRAERDADARRVRLSVSDNGPGMSEEVKRRCLEPFFSTKVRRISTGMGLALVRGLIEASGGSVSLDSKLGRGTTFTLSLPWADGDGPAGAEARGECTAAVTVADERTRAFVCSMLALLDVRCIVHPGDREPDAELWVVEPRNGNAEAAARFLRSGAAARGGPGIGDAAPARRRRIVWFGAPPGPADGDGGAAPAGEVICTGDQPTPAAVRDALRSAVEGSCER